MTGAAAPPGRVRIIGGEWRRRWLPVPPGEAVRPTPDRVRETLFNWLQPWLAGARCLDLFAGTGALGIEAVSRGAAQATLVECVPAFVLQVRVNVQMLAAEPRIAVIERDAEHFLAGPPAQPFNVIFVDPPYASDLAQQVLPRLAEGWLAPGALIYLETARARPAIALPGGWRMMRAGETRQARYSLVQAPG